MEPYLYERFYEVENTHWWFAARQEILEQYLLRRVPPSPSVRLLDVGCGTGAILERFSRHYTACGSDESPEAVRFCRRRGLTAVYEGTLQTLPEGTFDVITLLDVLEHAGDDRALLREAHRRLNPGGRILVTVPAFPSLWSVHDEVAHHRRRYTARGLAIVVRSAGFAIRQATFFNTFLFPVAVARRLAARARSASTAADFDIPREPWNALLRTAFGVERHLVGRVRLPFGLSLLCFAERLEA